jgi:hypothetical protein
MAWVYRLDSLAWLVRLSSDAWRRTVLVLILWTTGYAAEEVTYSIFDTTGNLVDAFTDRAAALACLAGIAQAEP